jgi:hypothetical protein
MTRTLGAYSDRDTVDLLPRAEASAGWLRRVEAVGLTELLST